MAEDVQATLEVSGSPPLAGRPVSQMLWSRVQSGSFVTPIEVVPRASLPALRIDLRAGFLFVYRLYTQERNEL